MKTQSILKKLAMLALLGAFVLGTGLVVGCEDSSDPADAIGDAAEDAAGEAAEAAEGAADDAASAIEDATN